MIKRLFIFILIILIFSLISIYYPSLIGKITGGIIITEEKEKAQVLKIIDGDTLETKENTVRLLGINTPERKQPYYQEAKDFLKHLENKTIQIQRDKENLDRYDRKLRYVFYEDQMVNIQILEQGLATTFMIEDLVYKDDFIKAETQAKLQNLNLWKKSNDQCGECIKFQELNEEEEFFIIENICNMDCSLEGWTVKDDANHITKLISISSNEIHTYNSKSNIWNNDGDRFFMRDKDGGLVVFYEY